MTVPGMSMALWKPFELHDVDMDEKLLYILNILTNSFQTTLVSVSCFGWMAMRKHNSLVFNNLQTLALSNVILVSTFELLSSFVAGFFAGYI